MLRALTTKAGSEACGAAARAWSEGGNAANWAVLRAVTTKLGRKAGSVVGNAAGADYEGGGEACGAAATARSENGKARRLGAKPACWRTAC